jgi:hypothetical protein
VANRILISDFKMPWRIPADSRFASLRDAPDFSKTDVFQTGLTVWDSIRVEILLK